MFSGASFHGEKHEIQRRKRSNKQEELVVKVKKRATNEGKTVKQSMLFP